MTLENKPLLKTYATFTSLEKCLNRKTDLENHFKSTLEKEGREYVDSQINFNNSGTFSLTFFYR